MRRSPLIGFFSSLVQSSPAPLKSKNPSGARLAGLPVSILPPSLLLVLLKSVTSGGNLLSLLRCFNPCLDSAIVPTAPFTSSLANRPGLSEHSLPTSTEHAGLNPLLLGSRGCCLVCARGFRGMGLPRQSCLDGGNIDRHRPSRAE